MDAISSRAPAAYGGSMRSTNRTSTEGSNRWREDARASQCQHKSELRTIPTPARVLAWVAITSTSNLILAVWVLLVLFTRGFCPVGVASTAIIAHVLIGPLHMSQKWCFILPNAFAPNPERKQIVSEHLNRMMSAPTLLGKTSLKSLNPVKHCQIVSLKQSDLVPGPCPDLLIRLHAMKASKCSTIAKELRQETSMVQVQSKRLERD